MCSFVKGDKSAFKSFTAVNTCHSQCCNAFHSKLSFVECQWKENNNIKILSNPKEIPKQQSRWWIMLHVPPTVKNCKIKLWEWNSKLDRILTFRQLLNVLHVMTL